jgi:hypothetical protein
MLTSKLVRNLLPLFPGVKVETTIRLPGAKDAQLVCAKIHSLIDLDHHVIVDDCDGCGFKAYHFTNDNAIRRNLVDMSDNDCCDDMVEVKVIETSIGLTVFVL